MTSTTRTIAGLLLAVSVAPLRGQESVRVAQHMRPELVPARAAAPERRLTLIDAVKLAVNANLEIEIERQTVASTMSGIGAAQAAFDPVIRLRPMWESATTPVSSILQASDGRLVDRSAGSTLSFAQSSAAFGSNLAVDFDSARVATSNAFASVSPYYTSRLSATLTQPLLRGRRTSSSKTQVEVRRTEVSVARAQFGLQLVDVVSRVEDAYWDLVGARQDAEVHEDAVSLAREQLEVSRRSVQSGSLARVNLAAFESEVERRRDELYRSLTRASTADNRLKVMLAGDIRDSIWDARIIPLDVRPPEPSVETSDLGGLLALAIKQRLEMREVAHRTEIVTMHKNLAADEKLPNVSLVVNYASTGLAGSRQATQNPLLAANASLYADVNRLSQVAGLQPAAPPPMMFGPGLEGDYRRSLSNMLSGRYQTFQVGLSVDLNLRNRAAEAAHSQAQLAGSRMRLEQRQLEQIIYQQVRDAVQGIESARQRVAAAEASSRAAHENLDSETRLFAAGQSTSFMVLTRQNELAQSRLRRVMATIDLNRAHVRLRQSLGGTLASYGLQ